WMLVIEMSSADVFDVVVVGAGPAGLSCGHSTAGAGFTTLIVESAAIGGQLVNVPSVPDPVSGKVLPGPELAASLAESAFDAGAQIAFGEVGVIRPPD